MKYDRFVQGYACAIACIVSGHGTSTETNEALVACGIRSVKHLRAARVDERDIEILRSSVKEIQSQRRRWARGGV